MTPTKAALEALDTAKLEVRDYGTLEVETFTINDLLDAEVIKTIKQALTANTWQSIETAIIDSNVRILIYGESFGILAWTIAENDMPDGTTHWQPLPSKPEQPPC